MKKFWEKIEKKCYEKFYIKFLRKKIRGNPFEIKILEMPIFGVLKRILQLYNFSYKFREIDFF